MTTPPKVRDAARVEDHPALRRPKLAYESRQRRGESMDRPPFVGPAATRVGLVVPWVVWSG